MQEAPVASDFRGNLLDAIAKVDRPGSIHASRDLPLTMPGLEVDAVGPVRLPLGTTQARELIKRCSKAAYGKGAKTVVDTSVRRVWELDPKHFKLTNPKWKEHVVSITDEVRTTLGLEQVKVDAHLYKLLMYEKGSFFLAHRDGEKLDGMVATLVIGLPSPHAGGELIISHEGKRYEISMKGAASGHELSYVAFYADCEHEVRPVTDGYRLCLVYNLTLGRSGGKKKIAAPQTSEITASISEILSNWHSLGDISKVAVTLEHQYTQDGLKFDALKGVDRARAEVLFDAAKKANCAAYLALVTHWQSGSAEVDGYEFGYGRGGYDSWSSEDEDEQAIEGTGHEMGEVFDESLSINHWSDRDGKKVAFGEMTISDEELVSEEACEDWDHGREDFEGYTGNAGMTLDRWYHRAAIVIWPKGRNFEVLCRAGTDAAITGLVSMVGKWKRATKSKEKEERSQCLEFANAIINTWGPRRFQYQSFSSQDKVDRSAFLVALQELDDLELVRKFLTDVMPTDLSLELDKGFLSFCKRHGWSTFQAGLTAIVEQASPETIARNAALLEFLCVQRDTNVARMELCKQLGNHAVTALVKFDKEKSHSEWELGKIDRPALLSSLVKALTSIEAVKPLDLLIEHTLAEKGNYDLTKVHIAVIFALETSFNRKVNKTNRVISRWFASCRKELERRTSRAPLPPADFRREEKLSCSCAFCKELSRFLGDPSKSVHHFRLAQDRRRHLHQMIDSNGCDLTHVTTRTGRPFTLVCTKTTASYKAAGKIYSRDLENLGRLREIEEKFNSIE